MLGLRLPAGDAPRLPTAGEAFRLLPDTEGLRLLISAGAALGLGLRLCAGELARLPFLAGEPLGDLLRSPTDALRALVSEPASSIGDTLLLLIPTGEPCLTADGESLTGDKLLLLIPTGEHCLSANGESLTGDTLPLLILAGEPCLSADGESFAGDKLLLLIPTGEV